MSEQGEERPTCATCKHYVPTNENWGGCKRYPPRTCGVSVVSPDDWCGEHSRMHFTPPAPKPIEGTTVERC